jgi:hypothetical protein
VEERATLLSCAASAPRAAEAVPAGWTEWRRTLVALLWANDFPPDHVNAMALRTDPAKLDPKSGAGPCDSAEAKQRADGFVAATWAAELRATFRRQGLVSDIAAPTEEQTRRLRDVVAKHRPAQARMLTCLGLTQPQFLGLAMQDWAKYVAGGRLAAQASGLPRDMLPSLFDPIEPNALLSSPRDRAEAAKSCAADQTWQDRYALFMPAAFAGDIREIFTGKR